jgi:hypothetical protein
MTQVNVSKKFATERCYHLSHLNHSREPPIKQCFEKSMYEWHQIDKMCQDKAETQVQDCQAARISDIRESLCPARYMVCMSSAAEITDENRCRQQLDYCQTSVHNVCQLKNFKDACYMNLAQKSFSSTK